MFAFEFDEAVVTAFFAVGEVAADRWACFVNGAAAVFRVQELARRFIDVVGSVAEDAFLYMVVRVAFGEFVITREGDLGSVNAEIKVFRQAGDVALCDDNPRIAATVAGAFAAVVIYFCFCHGCILCVSHGLVDYRRHTPVFCNKVLIQFVVADGMLWHADVLAPVSTMPSEAVLRS